MLIRSLPLLIAVTLACLHASAAQEFAVRRTVAGAGRQRAPRPAAAAAHTVAAPPPPPPRVSLPEQPAEPALAPHRFGLQQRAPAAAPAATSTTAPPRPPPSPPPPPPRFRLPDQPEEAAPAPAPVAQRVLQQARPPPPAPSTTAAPLPPPPPPPPPQALRPQLAEAVQPLAPTHRFAHERTTAKPVPLPAPTVLPQQPTRKVAPEVVSRSGDGKSEAALEEERQRQAESAQYSFGSNVQDSINDNMQSRQETRDGLKTVGQYSYSDGFYRRTVHYEADDKGYRVTREETETIGDGPQLNPDGRAEVESNVAGVHNKYAITIEDIAEQQP